MKLLTVLSIVLLSSVASARTQYLTDINTAATTLFTFGSVNNCTTCHTAMGSVNPPVFNTTFGPDFRAQATTVAPGRNPATTALTAAQIQTILQNMRNMDSDGDTFTNEVEISQNSAPENPAITPNNVAPPPEEDEEAQEKIMEKIRAGQQLNSDEAYQLNSGCGKPLNVQAFYTNPQASKTASAANLGFLILFSTPIGAIVLLRRRLPRL